MVGFPPDSFGGGEDLNSPIGGEITREAVGGMRIAMHGWYARWILAFLTMRPSGGRPWFTGEVSLASLTHVGSVLRFRLRVVECVPLNGRGLWEWRAAVGAVAASPEWLPVGPGRAP